MSVDNCIKRIERYLSKPNMQPLVVDVQNMDDLSALITYFNVGGNRFVKASEFAAEDEFPKMDSLLSYVAKYSGNCFIIGLSTFLKLQGDDYVSNTIRNLLAMNVQGHVVVLTLQCKMFLDFYDVRLKNRIWILEGDSSTKPSITFASKSLPIPENVAVVHGLDKLADRVESIVEESVYVLTSKKRSDFTHSLFVITDFNKAYDALRAKDASTESFPEEWGTDAQWKYALNRFGKYGWADMLDHEFGNHRALALSIPSYAKFDDNRKWLFFIGLKMFGAESNPYLSAAAAKTTKYQELIKQLYRTLLDHDPSEATFSEYYQVRKLMLAQLENPHDTLIDYCKVVRSKGKNALYYLTDNTQYEKEQIIALLDQYAFEWDRNELERILNVTYPALSQYLAPYRFKNPLLDTYFQEYKYQKVVNKVFESFAAVVTEQAERREYNAILTPRSSLVEDINRENTQLYFVDALGVEYLGYIVAVCKELGLMANIKVCRSELPSITSLNKEFLDVFADGKHPVVSVKELDEIKHHGKDSYNYVENKTPIHLIRELDLIRELLAKIKEKLARGTVGKVVIISDHGASRLAVISESETLWEMAEKGKHSGRCCLKSELDTQPAYATDAGDYWSLANYDRFKGSRKACVEVHGGATLEEVAVPIIELTYLSKAIEVYLLPVLAENATIGQIPEIQYSYKTKAAIQVFCTEKVPGVSLCIDGKYYEGTATDDHHFVVNLPDIKRPKTYYADVYACDNLIAEKLPFKVKSAGMMSSGKGIL